MSCADGRAGQQHEQPDRDQLERVRSAPATCGSRPEHDQAEAEIVRLGQRVQAGQRVGEAQQPDRAGEEEEDAGRDRDDREDVERELIDPPLPRGAPAADERLDEGDASEGGEQRQHQRDVDRAGGGRRRRRAAAARRCRRCRAAAPPSCGRRRPGPRSTPDQAERHHRQDECRRRRAETQPSPSSAEHAREPRFLVRELRRDGLTDVEAMHDELSRPSSGPDRQRARQQARERRRTRCARARRQAQRIAHEAGLQRQARIEGAPGDVDARDDRLARKRKHEPSSAIGRSRQRRRRRRRLVHVAAATATSAGGKAASGAAQDQPEHEEQRRRDGTARAAAPAPAVQDQRFASPHALGFDSCVGTRLRLRAPSRSAAVGSRAGASRGRGTR